ncbi:MAG: FHA domain-containing protein [Proteobacteria bacterium]|nr:FHA domain-containing protein [Pseudomonadota bacterium]MCP4922230.1 FHA domain-containing protein [Pseudomonadota bacterium]
MVLGSHEACDVVLDAPGVAPRHACAWIAGGGVVVSELGSGLPTYLDGRLVECRAMSSAGAVLTVGDAALELVVGAMDAIRPFLVQVVEEPSLSVVLAESTGRRRLELVEGRSAELAWVLARQMYDDAARGLSAQRVGWVHDGDLAARLWGSHGSLSETHDNSLNVCVFRLRAALDEAGFPRRLIEKRVRRTRFSGRLVGLAG